MLEAPLAITCVFVYKTYETMLILMLWNSLLGEIFEINGYLEE